MNELGLSGLGPDNDSVMGGVSLLCCSSAQALIEVGLTGWEPSSELCVKKNRQQSLNGDIADIVSLFATLGSSYSPLLKHF